MMNLDELEKVIKQPPHKDINPEVQTKSEEDESEYVSDAEEDLTTALLLLEDCNNILEQQASNYRLPYKDRIEIGKVAVEVTAFLAQYEVPEPKPKSKAVDEDSEL